MVCEPEVLELIDSDQTVFEQEPLQTLASDGELSAYKHDGFGNVWILCETKQPSINSGMMVKLHGKYGRTEFI